MTRLKPYLALPIITAAVVGVFALFWVVTFTILAMFLSTLALGVSSATARSLPAPVPAFSTAVVPGVWPVHDHTASWNAGVSAHDQSVFMFGSERAADRAGVIYDSAAWSPTLSERPAALTAWRACLIDARGDFLVAHSFALYIEPGDCQAFWNGTLRGPQLEVLFGNW